MKHRSALPAVLLLAAAVSLSAGPPPAGLFEARVRLGAHLPGRCERSILGAGDTVDVEPGLCAGLEAGWCARPRTRRSAWGPGSRRRAHWRDSRGTSASSRSTGQPGWASAAARRRLPRRPLWLGLPVRRRGVHQRFGRLTGGLYYAAGIGAELLLPRFGRRGGALFLETIYSAAAGALTDDYFGLRTDLRAQSLAVAAGLAKGF